MEKRTIETLRSMVCGELEEIAKKGNLSHECLDILKDLLESAKNLEKIEKYQGEREEKEMDMGYSQRKYFIDADYDPRMRNSYRGRAMYDADYGRNSYMYYDPRYGYSRMSSKAEMISELERMMNESGDEKIKTAIQEAINKMNK